LQRQKPRYLRDRTPADLEASSTMRTHLGIYSDWVEAARKQADLYPVASPGEETRQRIRKVLGFSKATPIAENVRIEASWKHDGLTGEEISWSVGYGPRTQAWFLRPEEIDEPLPGVLALHGHDGFKFLGKAKVTDGKERPPEAVQKLRAELYEGTAFANELAKQGFAVLVHDVFLWGSRRFPFETMPQSIHRQVEDWEQRRAQNAISTTEIDRYNAAARWHEHLVAKYCTLLGTSLAGVVNFEDRVALRYLRSRSDVRSRLCGCIGLSGGGCRAALLQATCDDIGAAVVVGMMTTHPELLDHHVEPHTWMFFPPGLAMITDWPDLAASRAPSPLLVQYNRDDQLFPIQGMQSAHARIASHYERIGQPSGYAGRFYDGPHKFDKEMQKDAFAWLSETLNDR
jgi:dienelactone hydrolase